MVKTDQLRFWMVDRCLSSPNKLRKIIFIVTHTTKFVRIKPINKFWSSGCSQKPEFRIQTYDALVTSLITKPQAARIKSGSIRTAADQWDVMCVVYVLTLISTKTEIVWDEGRLLLVADTVECPPGAVE